MLRIELIGLSRLRLPAMAGQGIEFFSVSSVVVLQNAATEIGNPNLLLHYRKSVHLKQGGMR
jgi:hypothetical protein